MKAVRRGRDAFGLVEVLVVIAIVGLLLALLLAAIQYARSTARAVTCNVRLRDLALAVNGYEAANGTYPFDYVFYSGWTRCLPYFSGGSALYDEIDWNDPFSEACQRKLAAAKPPYFHCPEANPLGNASRTVELTYGGNAVPQDRIGALSSYAVCAGTILRYESPPKGDGVYTRGVRYGSNAVVDGLSKTLLLGEVRTNVGVGPTDNPTNEGALFQLAYKDQDIAALRADCLDAANLKTSPFVTPVIPVWYVSDQTFATLVAPGSHGCRFCGKNDPKSNNSIVKDLAVPAGILHTGLTNVAFADGSVRGISREIDVQIWSALGTRNGGEPSADF